jgi:hypothetical protein
LFELAECFANRRLTGVKLTGEIQLHESIAGQQLPQENPLGERFSNTITHAMTVVFHEVRRDKYGLLGWIYIIDNIWLVKYFYSYMTITHLQ